MNTLKTCPQCGKPFPEDAPEGLCPECLVGCALGSASSRDTMLAGESAAAAVPIRPRGLPGIGETFGEYRIVRELGRGGMGAVYEAEQAESGRRLALKVLGHRLDSPDARKRFMREGRLAASINHPNSVYVYGTDEVDGVPVIAMELVAGGTLQEQVERDGPFPIDVAVDAVLQVIAGLEAAQALGILHRDIKPSNCFKDADGTVKVGDFGLSISTAARGDTNVTVQGALLGTPAFASPEQLRGEELNARSDMYSVGVTLFYLLTGRTPFEAPNMVHLIANVLEQAPPSPRKLRPAIPPDLARLVLRCLQKQPGERPKTYDELRRALAPFSSSAPVPASPATRLAAGGLDMVTVGVLGMAVCLAAFGDLLPFAGAALARNPRMVAMVLSAFVLVVGYYSVLEGVWGASVGKMICRLRVTGDDRNPPGLPRALLRTLIFQIVPVLPYWVTFGFASPARVLGGGPSVQYSLSALYYLLVLVIFCTARKRNGYAGIHDLATRTRVVRRPAYQARPVPLHLPEAPAAEEPERTLGPYHVLRIMEGTPADGWLLGYDPRLLRKVWIRALPAGLPPIPAKLRDLGRPGRLRWVAGRRSETENWDAYEAPGGASLPDLARAPRPWGEVRFWLWDLARELRAAAADGTVPGVLAADRVRITADGRAKLLDFPAPGSGGLTAVAAVPVPRSPQEFLRHVARVALLGVAGAREDAGGIPVPLPLPARDFLAKLPDFPDLGAVNDAVEPLTRQIPAVSRVRRAGLIAACAVFPCIAAASILFGGAAIARLEERQPGVWGLSQLLQVRSTLRGPLVRGREVMDDRTFGIYIAANYRSTITDPDVWSGVYALAMARGGSRAFAEQCLVDYPAPTEEEVRAATERLGPLLSSLDVAALVGNRRLLLMAFGATWIMYVAIPAILAALLFRGGLVQRALRVAVVRRDGADASRLRVFWRSLVAWSPVLAAPMLMGVLTSALGPLWAAALPALLVTALAAGSVAAAGRSLQDRLAGTCLVPR